MAEILCPVPWANQTNYERSTDPRWVWHEVDPSVRGHAPAVVVVGSETAGITPVRTTSAADHKVLSAEPCVFIGMNASSSVAGWFLMYDAISKPADGSRSPLKAWAVNAGQSIEVEYALPIDCAVGCTVVFSTTGPYMLTASATAFISGEVR